MCIRDRSYGESEDKGFQCLYFYTTYHGFPQLKGGSIFLHGLERDVYKRQPVMWADLRRAIQSVGNSATPPHDLETPADARCLYYLLAESDVYKRQPYNFSAKS